MNNDPSNPGDFAATRWTIVLSAARGEAVSRAGEAMKETLTGGRASRYAVIAEELGMTEGAVKTAAHRMRRRYRSLMREEIAQTVAGPEEIEEEIRYLLSCL